jgi:DNA-binding transcriptional regulator of glucitol operon
MSSGPSKVALLKPRWLLLHALTVAACWGMVWLGRWQWHAAIRHHGEIRNYAYAIQWWAFTGFAIVMWTRIVRDYLRQGTPDEPRPSVEGVPKYVSYMPPTDQPVDEDPERLRFNAYLAQLNQADREDLQ